MENPLPFKVFANCIIVDGAQRSTICDLQRNRIHLIPNSLATLLTDFEGSTVQAIKESFLHEYDEVIDEYFEFLEREEILFYSEMPQAFPPLNLQWHYPFQINNSIIDINQFSDFNYQEIFDQLDALNVANLEIRSYYPFDIGLYEQIVSCANNTTVTSVSFIVPSNANLNCSDWEAFCDKYNRITSITIHSCKQAQKNLSDKYLTPVSFITNILSSEKCCGIIAEEGFISSLETFTESLVFNSCLNRKISIDAEGNIKNCPSMKECFGNIKSTTLQNALAAVEFKKKWSISKAQINGCKDCEFRHVCTDCRAYLESPEDEYSKPLKCGYDPYTCTWEDWSQHPLKRNAIQYYNLSPLMHCE